LKIDSAPNIFLPQRRSVTKFHEEIITDVKCFVKLCTPVT